MLNMKSPKLLDLIFGVLFIGLVTAMLIEWTRQMKLKEENQTLRHQTAKMSEYAAENERLTNLLTEIENAKILAQEKSNELLKVRNEVAILRRRILEQEQVRKARIQAGTARQEVGVPGEILEATANRGYAAWSAGDFETAMKVLRPLAEQGYAPAQHRVGVMYVFGQGVQHDWTEAVRWFRASAEQGMGNSQFSMGLRYLEGQGVDKDSQSAARWLQLAADQGINEAASVLATLYSNGDGVPQDAVESYKWLAIANGQIEPNHGNLSLKDLAEKLTDDQLAEARRRASAFVPRPIGPRY
jgi:TPR repeat protein